MDYIKELENIKSWAKDLIILQYKRAKKNQQTIDLMTELLCANNLILQIRDLCLSVENSIGAQLDVVGKWVGLDRYYNAIDLWNHPYTALVNYENISSGNYEQWQGGFSTWENFEQNNGGFLTWEDWINTRTKVNAMGDAYFRALIKLKIIKNEINHTCKNIDDAIWAWSNGNVYTTWDVMKITYHYTGNTILNAGTSSEINLHNLMQLAVYKNVLVAPTGCEIEIEEL